MTHTIEVSSALDRGKLKEIMTRQALTSINELMQLHWDDALDAANEKGVAKIGFSVQIEDKAAPPKVTVTLGITQTLKDEIETTLSDEEQQELAL